MSTDTTKRNPERPRTLPANILDAMREPAAVMDVNFCIARAGRSFCRVFGRSLNQIEGHMLYELGIRGTDAQKLKVMVARLLENNAESTHASEKTTVELSGLSKIFISGCLLDVEADGSPLILLSIINQFDEPGIAAAPLHETRYSVSTLPDTAFEGIALIKAGMFIDLNYRLAQMLGYRREDLLGIPVLDSVVSEHHECVVGIMTQPKEVRIDSLMLRKDGTHFPAKICLRSAQNNDREIRLLSIHDVSGSKQTEKELRLARYCLEHAPVGVLKVAEDARIFSVNNKICDDLGYSREEILNLNLFDLNHNFSKENWKEKHCSLREQGHIVFETKHTRKDGSELPVEVTVNHHDFEGKSFSIAFVKNITKQKRYEKNLKLTQFIIDQASFGCTWIGKDARFFYANDQACRDLGYSRNELLQMSVLDVDPSFDAQVWADYWKLLHREGFRTFETIHQRSDSSLYPVEIKANYVEFDGNEYSCTFTTDISERKIAEENLRHFQFSIDRASEAIFWMNSDGGFLYVNDQACRSLDCSRDDLMKLHLWDIDPMFSEEMWAAHWQEMEKIESRVLETTHRRKDGTLFPVEVFANHIHLGDKVHHVAFVRDITERKQVEEEKAKLESQLFQAQKMESIGRLAGGIAHDFNNMLGVILGHAELMKLKMVEDDPLQKDILQIEKAAVHSKDITSQLLAFSRKQVISPKLLDLNSLVTTLQKTLARLIGENVELQFFPDEALWKTKFDPIQIEQILINLSINGRDAMPGGGKLTIDTRNIHLDDIYCRNHVGLMPGNFVQLSVSDNGSGMDMETLSHVFEPFFTTKDIGKGTGLGLATVYGIVKQGGGFINAYSEPEHGTTFKIYLPRTIEEGEMATETHEEPLNTGTETVLLVEDDEMVREMTQAMLEKTGYNVMSVATPTEALGLLEEDETPIIHLLITDVVMPKMNGKELHDHAVTIRPNIKTLFMSGYTASVVVQHGVLNEGINFIQKPFNLKNLAHKIRNALV